MTIAHLPASDETWDPTVPLVGRRAPEQGPLSRRHDGEARRLPTFDGRYVAGALIGRGGTSSVYAARDVVLGREVAVKLFTASTDDAVQLRAEEREARLLAGLDHRALTTVFDAGIDTSEPGRPRAYLVMERMHGGDLRARLERGALPPHQVACLGADLAKGLRHLHDRGLLHRDIKPANVLLTAPRTDGLLHGKLADFGISSPIGTPESENTMGTAAYISPEQAAGDSTTPASDVYALGLVLLEAATGVLEFPGSADDSALARLERDPHVAEHVPTALAAVLVSMLHQAPGDRAGLPAIIRAFESLRTRAGASGRSVAAPPPEPRDESSDEVFDGIASIAARLLDAPVAIVSLAQADPADAGDALWTCPDADAKPWAIADVRDDPRLVDSATLAAAPDLRALAAAPLTARDGRTVGTLGVLDRRVRAFSAADLSDLSALALILSSHHELRLSVRRALFPASME